MQDVKILSLIPENLHDKLFKEVQEVLEERKAEKSKIVNPEVKKFVQAQKKEKTNN